MDRMTTTATTTEPATVIAALRAICRPGVQLTGSQEAGIVNGVTTRELRAIGRPVSVRLRPEPGQLARRVIATGTVTECAFHHFRPAGRGAVAVFRVKLDTGRVVFLTTV